MATQRLRRRNITPGDTLLLPIKIVRKTIAAIVTLRNPGGDYAKVLKALRNR